MDSNKCPECGKNIIDGAKFCPSCGCPVTKQLEIPVKDVEVKSFSSEKKKTIGILAGVFIAIIALIVWSSAPVDYYDDTDDAYYYSDNSDDTSSGSDFETSSAPKDEQLIDADGKSMWKIYCVDGYMTFDGTFSGGGNFIVEILDSNQNLQELVCNEIGDYILDNKTVYVGTGYHYLLVECSDGYWNMTWTGTGGN